jgi:TRAP-type C4-dicarboxylate transport system permease small subunit
VFTRILDVLEKILRVLASCFFAVMVFSISYQIVLRYAFAEANAWSEELARYSFVWLVMLAGSVGTRRARHMNIDFFLNKLPYPLKFAVEMAMRALALLFFVILGYKGADLSQMTMLQNSTGLEIPMGYVYVAIPVGAASMILFTLEDTWNIFWNLLRKSPQRQEVADGA